jgi:hypothetical protein
MSTSLKFTKRSILATHANLQKRTENEIQISLICYSYNSDCCSVQGGILLGRLNEEQS